MSFKTFFVFVLITVITISAILFFSSGNKSEQPTTNHTQMQMSEVMQNMPGMQGDKTKRYSVDWDYEEPVMPGSPVIMRFRVFNASSGEPVGVFTKNYTKLMHLIIADSSLTDYQHLHPEYKDGWFEISVIFPEEGRYNLYLDFVPLGGIEQQIGMSLKTANFTEEEETKNEEDLSTKKVEGYKIALKFTGPLKADMLSKMEQKLTFEITQNEQPVTALKPYLGAFGHMVMINTETFDYYHVHPVQNVELKEDAIGGPNVEFAPMAIYQQFKPGNYRIFAQFNPDGNLITVPFTVNVE